MAAFRALQRHSKGGIAFNVHTALGDGLSSPVTVPPFFLLLTTAVSWHAKQLPTILYYSLSPGHIFHPLVSVSVCTRVTNDSLHAGGAGRDGNDDDDDDDDGGGERRGGWNYIQVNSGHMKCDDSSTIHRTLLILSDF